MIKPSNRILITISILIFIINISNILTNEDFYKLLEVNKNTSQKDLKRQFRKLSAKYHPDKNKGNKNAQDKFIRIQTAYDTLSNPEKRKIYDIYGEEGLSKENNLQEQRKPRGQDAKVDVTVDLAEFYNGAEKDLQLQKNVICNQCHGTGGKLGKTQKCNKCHGSGQVVEDVDSGMGFTFKMQNTCNKCGGKGITFKETCPHCRGRRVVKEDKVLKVVIEKGMKDREQIVFPRESEQHPDAIPGDLVVTLKQRSHSFFTKREGDNLHASIALNFKEALLGYERTFRHLDGRQVTVKSDKPTQPFAVKTMSGEGMPQHNFASHKGDLLLKQTVRLPDRLTQDEKKLVEQLFE